MTETSQFIIPGSGMSLQEGYIVALASYPDVKWVVRSGWYTYGGQQFMGWYFVSITDGTIIPVSEDVLNGLTIIAYDAQSVPPQPCNQCGCNNNGQGSQSYPTPGCPWPPIPPRPPVPPIPPIPPVPPYPPHPDHGLSPQDREQLARAVITVDSEYARDQIDPKYLVNGKICRVNYTQTGPQYFVWNSQRRLWEVWQVPGLDQYLTIDQAAQIYSTQEDTTRKINDAVTEVNAHIESVDDRLDYVVSSMDRKIAGAVDDAIRDANIPQQVQDAIEDSDTIREIVQEVAAEEVPALVDTAIAQSQVIQQITDQVDQLVDDNYFKDVEVIPDLQTGDTALRFTHADGTTTDVTITDMFLSNATYDSETHILTLYVQGSSTPIEVDLGDIVAGDTSQIEVSRPITLTADIGNLKAGTEIITEGEPGPGQVLAPNLQALLEAILSTDANPVVKSRPAVSFSGFPSGSHEVGSIIPVSNARVSLSRGSYAVGSATQDGGVTSNGDWTGTGGMVISNAGAIQAFDIQIADNQTYTYTASCTGSIGNMPKTFLGNDYPDIRFAEGATYSKVSPAITGYRLMFAGGAYTDISQVPMTSSDVRGLSVNGPDTLPTLSNPFEFTCVEGHKSIIFAIRSSQVVQGGGPNCLHFEIDVMGWSQVSMPIHTEYISVPGQNAYEPVEYTLFYLVPVSALETDTNFRVYFGDEIIDEDEEVDS